MTTEITAQTNRVLQLMQKSLSGTERIDPDRNLRIYFKPSSIKMKVDIDIMFKELREFGLGPYWQTMQCDPNVVKGYTFGFTVPKGWLSMGRPYCKSIQKVQLL